LAVKDYSFSSRLRQYAFIVVFARWQAREHHTIYFFFSSFLSTNYCLNTKDPLSFYNAHRPLDQCSGTSTSPRFVN